MFYVCVFVPRCAVFVGVCWLLDLSLVAFVCVFWEHGMGGAKTLCRALLFVLLAMVFVYCAITCWPTSRDRY